MSSAAVVNSALMARYENLTDLFIDCAVYGEIEGHILNFGHFIG